MNGESARYEKFAYGEFLTSINDDCVNQDGATSSFVGSFGCPFRDGFSIFGHKFDP
jgi:hypothetical protein